MIGEMLGSGKGKKGGLLGGLLGGKKKSLLGGLGKKTVSDMLHRKKQQ